MAETIGGQPDLEMTTLMSEQIAKRIEWLKQKEAEQRRVGGPEFTSSKLLWGRTQGEIGALKWVLSNYGQREFKRSAIAMNDDRQAGRKEIGGGGEWTALREALDDMRKEAKRLIDRSEVLANNGEKHRSDISLARGREIEGAIARLALAAAAPAPPAKVYALLDYEADGDALISVHATEESANKAKELVAPIRCWIQECDVVAPPPQDG